MSDSAQGPISGFLYQFQKALLVLVALTSPIEGVSLEDVDDIAVHDGENQEKILMAFQAKHTLSMGATMFGDSSKSLWRTLEIWIGKFEEGIFDTGTEFICATNLDVPSGSLVRLMESGNFEKVLAAIEGIEASLKEKLAKKEDKEKEAPHISYIIKRVELVLKKKDILEKIITNLRVEILEEAKPKFLELMRLNVEGVTIARQNLVYEGFYGWLIDTCYAKWRNSEAALVTKEMFDRKWVVMNSNPQLVNAIFRKKKDLGSLASEQIEQLKDELFVQQIADINRGQGGKTILDKAMLDFIHHKIEMSFVVTNGDFTETDFEEFEEQCWEIWHECYLSAVTKDDYDEQECNQIAIKIYDEMMQDERLHFKEGFRFTPTNRYIKNGSFLKLSNIPNLGWRPDWKLKYRPNE